MMKLRMNRRRVSLWLITVTTILLFGLAATACVPRTKQKYQMTVMYLFDTVTMITGYAESEEMFNQRASLLIRELRDYHELCDVYHVYEGIHNVKTINDLAGGEPVPIDRRLMDVLLFARRMAELTDGTVDVTLGAVLRQWHEVREEAIANPESARLPDPDQLEEARKHTGMDLLELDEGTMTARLSDPEASLDLGAIAKGYAAQKVCEGVESGWLINLGGNVIATGPKPENQSSWTVGIQDPDGTGSEYLHVVSLNRGAVVTSGDYQRFFELDGIRYHHLIDPTTLQPGRYWRAVTVLSEDSGLADGLSTALFLMDHEAGEAILAAAGAEAAWVGADGTVLFSHGYTERLH